MKRLSWYVGLVALLAAVTLGAQAQPLTGGLLGRPTGSYATMTAPPGCVATSVPIFMGSPVAMGCDAGLTYDPAGDVLTTGRVLIADGSGTSPAIGSVNYPGTGFSFGANRIDINVKDGTGTDPDFRFYALSTGAYLWFNSDGGAVGLVTGTAFDTPFMRQSAGVWRIGFSAAAADGDAAGLQIGQGATGGTNKKGGDGFIQCAPGTGAATPCTLTFKTATATASGTTDQTEATRMTMSNAGVTVPVGTGGATAKVGGAVSIDTTEVATGGTSEEILLTYTLPAGTLATNGQAIRITAVVLGAANSNNKAATIRFGGIGGTQIATHTTATSSGPISLVAIVVRTGAATQTSIGTGVSWTASKAMTATPTATLSNAIDIVLTGTTASAAGDLTSKLLMIEALN